MHEYVFRCIGPLSTIVGFEKKNHCCRQDNDLSEAISIQLHIQNTCMIKLFFKNICNFHAVLLHKRISSPTAMTVKI